MVHLGAVLEPRPLLLRLHLLLRHIQQPALGGRRSAAQQPAAHGAHGLGIARAQPPLALPRQQPLLEQVLIIGVGAGTWGPSSRWVGGEQGAKGVLGVRVRKTKFPAHHQDDRRCAWPTPPYHLPDLHKSQPHTHPPTHPPAHRHPTPPRPT